MRALVIVALLVGCERQPPGPEVRIGGPYREALRDIREGTTLRARGQEADRFAPGALVYIALEFRGVYEQTIDVELVDGAGVRCWSQSETFGNEEARINPLGWGYEGMPLPPPGVESPCAEGRGLRAGRYTLRVALNGARVGERNFEVR